MANNGSEKRNSAESNRRKRSWKFHRHREPETQSVLLISKNISPIRYRNTSTNENLPSYIYRTDPNTLERQQADIFIQDFSDTEYRILDPAKLNVRRLSDQVNIGYSRQITASFCFYVNSALSLYKIIPNKSVVKL